MTGIQKTAAPAAFTRVATCTGKRLAQCLAVVVVVSCTGVSAWAQSFTEYTVPTVKSSPHGITAGPDGNLWFTEFSGDKIGKVTTTGAFTEYPIPTANSGTQGITAGPDGNLWFTESDGNQIGRVTTAGTFTEYTVPTANGEPFGITTGPDGNLWFTEGNTSKIGKVTTTGTFTEYIIPTAGSQPVSITTGPDGNLWFTEYGAQKIGRITTTGTFTEYPIPTANGTPYGITTGPDGNLWFTETAVSANKIGKVTTTGTFTEYTVPIAPGGPGPITLGADGNLWFTEGNPSGNKIMKVTTTGTFTGYTVPIADGDLFGITTGPDGKIWFTDESSNEIGVLSLPCQATPASGCRGSGKSLLLLKNNADDTKDKLTWKWIKGDATTLTDLGVPTGTTNYALCVYAGTAVATINLPAGSDWQAAGTSGFKFKDASGTPDGAQKAVLKSGSAGKAKALVKGKGANLPDDLAPALPLPVTVQLVNDTNNVCFEGVYTMGNVIKNDTTQFKAKTP